MSLPPGVRFVPHPQPNVEEMALVAAHHVLSESGTWGIITSSQADGNGRYAYTVQPGYYAADGYGQFQNAPVAPVVAYNSAEEVEDWSGSAVPDGTIIWFRQEVAKNGNRMRRFTFGGSTIPPGTVQYQVLTWDDEEEDAWAAGWVKGHG